METQPFALEALDALQVGLDSESDSETVESLGASRGILIAVGICLPFWMWVSSILF